MVRVERLELPILASQTRCLTIRPHPVLAGRLGVEPRLAQSKCAVLPLDDLPIFGTGYKDHLGAPCCLKPCPRPAWQQPSHSEADFPQASPREATELTDTNSWWGKSRPTSTRLEKHGGLLCQHKDGNSLAQKDTAYAPMENRHWSDDELSSVA